MSRSKASDALLLRVSLLAALFVASCTWGASSAGKGAAGAPAGADTGPSTRAADTAQIDVNVEDRTIHVPDTFTMRARVTAIKPAAPTGIAWRHGGEGLGGEVTRGALAEKLDIEQWSPPVPVNSFVKGRFPGKLFLTFMVGEGGKSSGKGGPKTGFSTGVEVEFEFSLDGKVVKTFKEAGPDGGTIGIVIPAYRLAGGARPDDPKFLDELTGILPYATRRAETLEKLPWGSLAVPRKYAILTDVACYGQGSGYGIRTTNKAVVEAECRSLRQIGVNSLRSAPEFLAELAYKGEGIGQGFNRARDVHAMGYPVPTFRAGRTNDPEAGCPFGSGVARATEEGVKAALENMLSIPLPEVWGLTVDEIGAVVDHSAEGKGHFATCPRCSEAFRKWLKDQGLSPGDFGKSDWSAVSPLGMGAKAESRPAAWGSPGDALAAYYTRAFNNYASAKLFTPLRDALAKANIAKRKALEDKRTDSPEAKQPWVYSYALRGNTFLMKGHSLDFFDFYRHADNAFVYEMSNRGPQVWGWDSYLCDVGRTVSGRMGVRFGVYVKPHRGAPIQRALTAVSRGSKMIYWYTYGPDYHKGDSFSQSPEALELVSKAARILGKSEDVLYGSSWARGAEVAVVKPRTSEIWMQLAGDAVYPAAWENAKWTYTALTHAHIPVDAIDEVMLANDDLTRYKVIYVSGPNVTKAAAEKLAKWVQAGGTLYTSGWGLVKDEGGQPLKALQPVLGLDGRNEPEMYYRVPPYGATALEPLNDPRNVLKAVPDGAAIHAGNRFAAFKPVVGREVLKPAKGAEVFADFADGGAAMTRNAYGKGQAYVAGFFPGLEYSAEVRRDEFDMSKDFNPAKAEYATFPAWLLCQPVVQTSLPTVEGVLLRNDQTGKLAVTLMNWTYRVAGRKTAGKRVSPVVALVPFKDLKITIRHAGAVNKATSVWLNRPLPVVKSDDALTVTLPELAEGDVLLLE